VSTFSKYYNVRDFFKQNGVGGAGVIDWIPTFANYPDMGTLFSLETAGFGAAVVTGSLFVTWYVEFKAPHL